MQEMTLDPIQMRIYNWLMRRTTNSAVRRVGELPLSIGSDIGFVRNENQDRVAVLRMQLDKGNSVTIAALCDGMGGMLEGSACAAQAISSFFMGCIRHQDVSLRERLVLATQEANQVVHSLYQGRGGATISAVLFDSSGGMLGVNVGDSRIYKYQEGTLEQITVDDTLADLLKNDLQPRNELLQFVGMGEGMEPHVIDIPTSYDFIILTTDGVHFIDRQVLQMVIQAAKDSAIAVRRLIDIAKWCGGRDNASVIAITPYPPQLPLLDDTDVVQIWDPFGELQVVLSKAIGNAIAEKEPTKDGKVIVAEPAENTKRLTKHKKKSKPAKRKTTPKNQEEVKKERPQLNIYFNGNAGKDNHG